METVCFESCCSTESLTDSGDGRNVLARYRWGVSLSLSEQSRRPCGRGSDSVLWRLCDLVACPAGRGARAGHPLIDIFARLLCRLAYGNERPIKRSFRRACGMERATTAENYLGLSRRICGVFGSYRVWRKERITRHQEVTQMQSRLAEPAQDSSSHGDRQEVLHLLRYGKWTAPQQRPMTGAGFPMVYESELADNSPALNRLGELRLHNLLMEMKSEGLIDHSQHEGNRWFARYG